MHKIVLDGTPRTIVVLLFRVYPGSTQGNDNIGQTCHSKSSYGSRVDCANVHWEPNRAKMAACGYRFRVFSAEEARSCASRHRIVRLAYLSPAVCRFEINTESGDPRTGVNGRWDDAMCVWGTNQHNDWHHSGRQERTLRQGEHCACWRKFMSRDTFGPVLESATALCAYKFTY